MGNSAGGEGLVWLILRVMVLRIWEGGGEGEVPLRVIMRRDLKIMEISLDEIQAVWYRRQRVEVNKAKRTDVNTWEKYMWEIV